jgi:hypothetical protein
MSIRNGKDLEIDPLATLFPPMADEEFSRLKADIAARGQLEPIRTHSGKVIEGRHLLLTCRELGLESVVREYDGDGVVLDFVIAKNLHRRQLNDNQRALVVAKLAKLSGAGPRKRPENRQKPNPMRPRCSGTAARPSRAPRRSSTAACPNWSRQWSATRSRSRRSPRSPRWRTPS